MVSATDQESGALHVYRPSKAMTTVCVVAGSCASAAGVLFLVRVLARCKTGFALDIDFVPAVLALGAFAAGLALIRAPFQQHLILSRSTIQVNDNFRTHVIPLSEIRGMRTDAGRGVSGIYLYRINGPRIFVRESFFQLDDFYGNWRSSLPNLDVVDKEARRTAGKLHWWEM